MLRVPDLRYWELSVQSALRFALVINAIEANDSLEEDMKLFMAGRIFRNFEEGLKDVLDDLLKVVHQASRLVDIEQSGDLDEPPDVVREQLVVDNPCCEFIPLVECSSVNRDSPFNHLVLARLEIRDDFFGDLSKIPAVDEVIGLQEDCPQPRLSNGIVFQVELVKAVEGICVSLLNVS